VQTSGSTIYRTKKRFVEISLEAALIPTLADQNPWAQSRSPMDMMRQG